MEKKINSILVYRIIFTIIGWFGLIGSLTLKITHRPPEWSILRSIWSFLSYYTIQTNIIVIIWFTVAVFYWKRGKENPLLKPKIKGAFTLYITATFLIYAVLLNGLWSPKGMDLFLSIITHYITPVAIILDWILTERKGDRKQSYKWSYALQWLVYPLCYLVYNQIYGKLTGLYLYPFLNLPQIGWSGLAIRVIILCVFFIVFGCMYIFINKIPSREKDQGVSA